MSESLLHLTVPHGRGVVYVWAECDVCQKNKVVEIHLDRNICEQCKEVERRAQDSQVKVNSL